MPHVDGLRAIAIATVVAYHAWPSLLTGGFIGVDVFFVISGFLITRLILAELQAGTFSLIVFLARRIRRLLPAAALSMTVVIVAGAVILLPETFRELGRSVVAASLMFANLLFYRTAGYFSAPADEKPLLHAWSLSVEDQFYLTWPLLLMLLAPRLPRAALIAFASALLLASFAHAELKLSGNPDYVFYMLLPRAWELLAGCLLAMLAGGPRPQLAGLLAAAGMALIGASAVLLAPGARFPGLGALPAVVGTMMVIAAGLGGPDGPAPAIVRLLSWRPIVLAGLVSYSLYLWHWPILSLGQYAASRPLTGLETAAAVVLSIGLAVLSWRYVERPFRLHGPMPAAKAWRTILVGGVVMGGMAATGGAIRALDGLPMRFDGAVGKLFDEVARGNPMRPACDGFDRIAGNDSVCNFGRRKGAGQSYDIAVFGDSNADHLVPMMVRWADERQLAGRQVTQSACAPLLGVAHVRRAERENRQCRSYHEAIVRFVEANPGLKVAVLGGVWSLYQNGIEWNGVAVPGAPQPAATPTLDTALQRTVAFFRSRGIRVHIVGQVPHFRVMPSRCAARALVTGGDVAACGRPSAEVAGVVAPADRLLQRLADADPGVSFMLPTRVMCDAKWCSPMKDGVFLYRDALHLNSAGSRHLYGYFAFPEVR